MGIPGQIRIVGVLLVLVPAILHAGPFRKPDKVILTGTQIRGVQASKDWIVTNDIEHDRLLVFRRDSGTSVCTISLPSDGYLKRSFRSFSLSPKQPLVAAIVSNRIGMSGYEYVAVYSIPEGKLVRSYTEPYTPLPVRRRTDNVFFTPSGGLVLLTGWEWKNYRRMAIVHHIDPIRWHTRSYSIYVPRMSYGLERVETIVHDQHPVALVSPDVSLVDMASGVQLKKLQRPSSWQAFFDFPFFAVDQSTILLGEASAQCGAYCAGGICIYDASGDLRHAIPNPSVVSASIRKYVSPYLPRRDMSSDAAEELGCSIDVEGDYACATTRHEDFALGGVSGLYVFDVLSGRLLDSFWETSEMRWSLRRDDLAIREGMLYIHGSVLCEKQRKPAILVFDLAKCRSNASSAMLPGTAAVLLAMGALGSAIALIRLRLRRKQVGPTGSFASRYGDSGADIVLQHIARVTPYRKTLRRNLVLLTLAGTGTGIVLLYGDYIPYVKYTATIFGFLMLACPVLALKQAREVFDSLKRTGFLAELAVLPLQSSDYTRAFLKLFAQAVCTVLVPYLVFWSIVGFGSGALQQIWRVGRLGEFLNNWCPSVALCFSLFWLAFWLLLYKGPARHLAILITSSIIWAVLCAVAMVVLHVQLTQVIAEGWPATVVFGFPALAMGIYMWLVFRCGYADHLRSHI